MQTPLLFLLFVLSVDNAAELDAARRFWAFQSPGDSAVPKVEDAGWPSSDLDFFVLAKLEAAELRPSPPADRRTLIRRAALYLTGLPPRPTDVEAFDKDESPNAWERCVDRLLASPRYGERWGRHWLDVARYADSNGLDENAAHVNAWRYRDYVIAAWNADKPFDHFVHEQLAGDLLGGDGERRREQLVATGFLSLGPKVLAEPDAAKMEMDIIDEQVDTVGRAFLGLSLGCARCHDHKFDPVRTEDYYALAGIFKSTKTMEHFKKVAEWNENSLATEEEVQRKRKHDERVAVLKKELDLLTKKTNGENRPADEKQRLEALQLELKKFEKSAPTLPTAMGVSEREVTDLQVRIRGNHLELGGTVPRAVPVVFRHLTAVKFSEERSGRLELARWLTEPANPLTARVLVNRLWRWHFGRGLVRTTDNFGKLGERPTHRELLDWLTLRFIEDRWSVKRLHRRILLSSTYRMSSAYDAHAAERDPENRLHWRCAPRRLEAEALRDSLLAVSGLLDLETGGTLLTHVKNRQLIFDHTSKDGTNYDSRRRSVYLPVVRNNLYEVFGLFDHPDPAVTSGDRATTTVPAQALFLLNGKLVDRAAAALADTLLGEETDDDRRLEVLYARCFVRAVEENEKERAKEFIARFARALNEQQKRSEADARRGAWAALVHVVLASNEFVYVR